MCARRFLGFIVFLILLFVAGAFAVYQWGGNVLLSQATPKGHFDAAKAGGGPDYSEPWNWIDHPELRVSPSSWRPENDYDTIVAPKTRPFVFYVHPTTYLERDRWNARICDGEECGEAGARAELFVRSQASTFGQFGTVWAPRYRQAAFGAFLLKSADAEKSLDFAYADVKAAFDYFLSQAPADAPLILAGHSQGALHISRLLREEASNLKGRLVAAYVVGWPLSTTADLPAMGLPACTAGDQTGCILSWQSFGEPPNPDLMLDAWQGTTGPTGGKRERRDMLCVNPLTGTRDGAAPPQANPGTLVPAADLRSAYLSPGLVGARCDNGFLLIDGAVPPMGPYVLPGNNYHVYDYALFWVAIRKDALGRLSAWQAR